VRAVEIKVLTSTEREEWHRLLRKAGGADVYYFPEYLDLYREEGEPILFAVEGEEHCLVYPFLKRPLLEQGLGRLTDLSSPYGYGGHYTSAMGDDLEQLLNSFQLGFDRYCSDNRVVSQFVRFHPLLNNHNYSRRLVPITFNRFTVAMDLAEGKERLWNNLTGTNKNRLRKSIKSGLVFREGKEIGDWKLFVKLYYSTMKRKNADPYYFFSPSYFSQLQEGLGKRARLFLIEKEGKVLSGAIFLCSNQFIHYHLGGSDPGGLSLAPNNLLFWETALWALEQGYSKLHLGGGYSSSSDQLYRFKQGFNKSGEQQFYLGKKINDQKLYRLLVEKRLERGEPAKEGFFPLYRG
jgi:hypothetical protein